MGPGPSKSLKGLEGGRLAACHAHHEKLWSSHAMVFLEEPCAEKKSSTFHQSMNRVRAQLGRLVCQSMPKQG
eukprot:124379-Amphidinium_carterae.1